jgi:transposase InsO family protein
MGIRTWQGWLYLAVVIDLFARNVEGWSMKPTLGRELVLDELMTAVWRRKPSERIIVLSDQEASMATMTGSGAAGPTIFHRYEPAWRLLG